jgi:hypothetical protein
MVVFPTNSIGQVEQTETKEHEKSGPRYSPPYIPDEMTFAGEKVPLEIDEVRERLERELLINTYWQSNIITMMKLSGRWFPLFKTIFDTMGVPEDFKYLSLVESRLSNEDSPKGAAGLWHLMPSTAKQLGLYLDNEIDERYDAEKATIAAGKYLIKAKERFGNWTNAAASYNRGMSGMSRAIDHQRVDHYYDLKMNSETARYVFRILAMKLIFEHPEHYNFHLEKEDYYRPWDTYSLTVDSAISDWSNFAEMHNTIYKYVRLYNPWIQEKYLRNESKRSYEVLIPNKTESYRPNNALKTKISSDSITDIPANELELEKQE